MSKLWSNEQLEEALKAAEDAYEDYWHEVYTSEEMLIKALRAALEVLNEKAPDLSAQG